MEFGVKRTGFCSGSPDGHPLVGLGRRQQIVDVCRPVVLVRQDVVVVADQSAVAAVLPRAAVRAIGRVVAGGGGQASGGVDHR